MVTAAPVRRRSRALRRAWILLSFVLLFVSATALPAQQDVARLVEEDGRTLLIEWTGRDLDASADHHDVTQPPTSVVQFPRSGWVHGFEATLVDAADRPVPSSVLHHVNLIVPQDRELFSNIMLRLGAAGPETGRVMMPSLIGYPVSAGDSLIVTAMFHNPGDEAYAGVRLQVRLGFTPDKRFLRPLAVRPFYMDVMPPDAPHSFDLPPGRSERSWEGSPAVAGRVLGVGGHLHRYGVLLRFEDVTSGRVIWEARPTFDADGNVESMPSRRYFLRLGVKVYPERVYRLTAIYDNPTGEVISDGGMGALGGVFIPSRGARLVPDHNHVEYRNDRYHTWAGAHQHGSGHAHHSPGDVRHEAESHDVHDADNALPRHHEGDDGAVEGGAERHHHQDRGRARQIRSEERSTRPRTTPRVLR